MHTYIQTCMHMHTYTHTYVEQSKVEWMCGAETGLLCLGRHKVKKKEKEGREKRKEKRHHLTVEDTGTAKLPDTGTAKLQGKPSLKP